MRAAEAREKAAKAANAVKAANVPTSIPAE